MTQASVTLGAIPNVPLKAFRKEAHEVGFNPDACGQFHLRQEPGRYTLVLRGSGMKDVFLEMFSTFPQRRAEALAQQTIRAIQAFGAQRRKEEIGL